MDASARSVEGRDDAEKSLDDVEKIPITTSREEVNKIAKGNPQAGDPGVSVLAKPMLEADVDEKTGDKARATVGEKENTNEEPNAAPNLSEANKNGAPTKRMNSSAGETRESLSTLVSAVGIPLSSSSPDHSESEEKESSGALFCFLG